MPQVYAETFEQVELAESWGLELCWFTEHHFLDDGYLPNFVPVAAAAAARTERMRFSTDICLLPFRHPLRLAEDLAILDNISNGRIELGAGMGYAAHEFAAFGLPVTRRLSLTTEAVEILQLAFRGERFSYHGKRYHFDDVLVTPPVVQEGGPPLWLAATSRAGAERAATYRTHLLPQGPPHAVLDPWREAVTATGGRPEERRIGLIRGVFITDDVERDWPAVEAAERYRRNVYVGLIKGSHDHQQAMARRSDDDKPLDTTPLNPLVWTVGDVDHCVGELTSLMVDHGVTDLVTWGGPPGLPPSIMNASLERFANDVVPRVRANLGEA